jgi:hypothetical protein
MHSWLPLMRKRGRGEHSVDAVRKKTATHTAVSRALLHLTPAMCDVTKWKGYKPLSDPVYSPTLISSLRTYFYTLPRTDKRVFLSPGVRCDEDTARGNAGGDMAYVPLLKNYRLEKPAELTQRLLSAALYRQHMPKPALMDCQPVRQKFLHWAVHCSTAFSNQGNRREPSKNVPKSFAERSFKVEPERRPHERAAPKKVLAAQWMGGQQREHLLVHTHTHIKTQRRDCRLLSRHLHTHNYTHRHTQTRMLELTCLT